MPRLRNISPHALDVFAPAGEADSFHVEAGQEITVNGELAAEHPDDAYQIGEGDDARLWPYAHWGLVEDAKPSTAATSPATTTGAGTGTVVKEN